jgi:peptidoglycan hydrolase-like protein with peptidoglycan-binding domain
VYRLHERLRAAGVFAGAPSEYFAPETEGAVLRFQQRERLVADGKVGPMTMIALYQRTSPEELPHLDQGETGTGVLTIGDTGVREGGWVETWEGGVP